MGSVCPKRDTKYSSFLRPASVAVAVPVVVIPVNKPPPLRAPEGVPTEVGVKT